MIRRRTLNLHFLFPALNTSLTALNLNDFVFITFEWCHRKWTASHAPLPDASSRSHSVTSHISHMCKLRPCSSCCQPVSRFLSGLSQFAGCTAWYEQRMRGRAKLSRSDCHLIIWHLWRNIIPGDGCRFSRRHFVLSQRDGHNSDGGGGDNNNNEDEFLPLKCLRESWPTLQLSRQQRRRKQWRDLESGAPALSPPSAFDSLLTVTPERVGPPAWRPLAGSWRLLKFKLTRKIYSVIKRCLCT